MSKKIGQATTYGLIIPGVARIAKITSLSKEAARRLKWIDHYRKKKNITENLPAL